MSRVRLGELLLSRGLCTREQLSEAWEQKVLYGDRLGTNLLALGIVDEATLASALGAQHGVHAGHGDVLTIDPVAVAALPKNVALKRQVVPHHVADRTLYLLMKDPDDLRAIDDVRFATRLKVQPVVVAEARLWRLLSEHYGAKSPLRPNPLDLVRKASSSSAASSLSSSEEAPADLVSEEEFQALYARLASGRSNTALGDDEPAADGASGAEPEAPELMPEQLIPVVSVGTDGVSGVQGGVQGGAQGGVGGGAGPLVDRRIAASEIPVVTAEATGNLPLSFFESEPDAPPVLEVPDWAESTRPIRLRLVAGQAVPDDTPYAPIPGTSDASDASGASDTSDTSDTSEVTTPGRSTQPPPSAPAGNAEDWQRALQVTNPMRAVPRALGLLDEIQLVEVADADPDTLPPDQPSSPFGRAPTTNASQIVAMPDLSPLAFDDAVALLKTATGRDDIARIVLRAARARFARACLITVYPHAFVGFQGVGEGYETEKLVDIALPRDAPSVFQLVADSRAHHLGPLQRFQAHGAWVKATGKKIPKSIAVLPVLVRGRCVNLLVVDNGHDQHVGGDVGELLILSRHIAGTYEQLIQRG